MRPTKDSNVDPRTLRTRKLLQQALLDLLKIREFDEISVQDIAEAATINRATFYAHYADKFELIECVIASRFDEFLSSRAGEFDSTCDSALENVTLAVSDYLLHLRGDNPRKTIHAQIELAIISVVKRMILFGIEKHTAPGAVLPVAPEMVAASVSWALYGAVKEWTQMENRSSVEQMVTAVSSIIKPIFSSLEQ